MKRPISGATLSCLSIFLLLFSSCVPQETETRIDQIIEPAAPIEKVKKQVQLPVQYQKPSYKVSTSKLNSLDKPVDDIVIKVGASIRSTKGPQPLWDILKRLAALKKMSVSWASDVDKYVFVDVDINANDDFDMAVKNLLRQVDYYHDIQGTTIVVKYKETRNFHIAMPYTKQLFETATGGNVLGSSEAASNIEGTIRLDSKGNEFDIWDNIKLNLDTIMDKWSYRRAAEDTEKDTDKTKGAGENASRKFSTGEGTTSTADSSTEEQSTQEQAGQVQKSAGLGYYIVDKHLGLITVTAPRPILKKVEAYLTTLKNNIYKQVSIEAKIIEVHIDDTSSIGLNWNLLLKNLSVSDGRYTFSENQSKNYNNGTTGSTTDNRTYNTTDTRDRVHDYTAADALSSDDRTTNTITTVADSVLSGTTAATSVAKLITSGGAAAISIAAFTFDSFLNAVKEQGQTTILSNPKLSVLNGQPALITVGRNVTYIDSIESDVNNETGTISYTVETERVLSGVGMALTANILDNKEIILNLVPVTSELEEPIEYKDVGLGTVGLPIINVREMSTTVKVRDGEMLVIGGLISNIEDESGTFIPGTSNLGFFKYLFGYEEKVSRKRELIILLRPRIIN
jgi:MSHA type pilus biogenesis protein MshL